MTRWTPSSPRNTLQKTTQVSSWYDALSQPAMGATFCFPISRLVSTKEVKVPFPKISSHFRISIAAYNPAEGERSGNKNIFRASPTPSGSSVWKVSAITMTAAAWGIHGGRNRRLSVVRWKAASIATLARSFLRGTTVIQMSGRCNTMLALKIRRRLRRYDPHCSVGVTIREMRARDV